MFHLVISLIITVIFGEWSDGDTAWCFFFFLFPLVSPQIQYRPEYQNRDRLPNRSGHEGKDNDEKLSDLAGSIR